MRIAACLACRRHSVAAAFAASLAVMCPYVAIAHKDETHRIVDAPLVHIVAAGRAQRFVNVDARAFARLRDLVPMPVPVAAPTPLVDDSAAVTLWDEISPPAPLPVPSDAQRTIRKDGVSDTRQ
ncbi:hypothetical protein [Burkholderia thailandensis]|uniref:hypothetical protein n=1 Tax=Burkholderia thailandensis TaxID=57975 RepID=UPI000AB7DE5D|nr:hypothetical protein [Burkholderia thailandensis]